MFAYSHMFTKLYWLDNVIAIIFGLFIFHTGYKLIKESVNNLLDEADSEKLNLLVTILNDNRKEKWIDMHNLRVLKFRYNYGIQQTSNNNFLISII